MPIYSLGSLTPQIDPQSWIAPNATVIGRGGNGSVSVITKRGTDQKFALKTVKTEELTEKLRIELRHEIQLQKSLDHPNIVRVYESFEDAYKTLRQSAPVVGGR